VISRWPWAGVDDSQDNYPMLFSLVAISGLSALLPAPEDGDGYSIRLRLDRLAVFGLGVGLANAEVELLKPIINRARPDEPGARGGSSRPSGHATGAFAAAAFFSDILRDTLRPEEESNIGLRLLWEATSAVPYVGAFYVGLERVHHYKHFYSDTLLGAAIGVFTTQFFWEWSFLRTELSRDWAGSFELSYERGFQLAWRVNF
jgi:membrane-associated phospholipid phosphatase